MDVLELNPATGPRVRWVYAAVLISSVFFIGLAALSLAHFGPCGAANPMALFASALMSATALVAAFSLLTEAQRRFRLRTVPFYLAVVVAVLFVLSQTLLFVLLTE